MFDFIFNRSGGHRKALPRELNGPHPVHTKKPNAHGSYTVTCPYCLDTFEVWEMPFRAVFTTGGSEANFNCFPLELDEPYQSFVQTRNIEGANNFYLGKVLTLFRNNNGVMEFDGDGIQKILLDDMRWYSPNEVNQEPLCYRSVIRVVDQYGHDTARKLCPHCHKELPSITGRVPNYIVMFMGDTYAGKTVFKHRLLYELDRQGFLNQQLTLGPLFSEETVDGIPANTIPQLYQKTFLQARQQAHHAIADITPISYIAPLIVPLLRNGIPEAMLTLYDFPGELIWHRRDDVEYQAHMAIIEQRLNRMDGIIFVLDASGTDLICGNLDQSYKPGQDAPAPAAPIQVLAAFAANFMTAEMNHRIRVPISIVFSKADLLKMLIEDCRDGTRSVPRLESKLSTLHTPPICVTNRCDTLLAAQAREERQNLYHPDAEKAYAPNPAALQYAIDRINNSHTTVDMANILRSHEELLSLFSGELGTFLTTTPKGLLFAVSAVGAPVRANEPVPNTDAIRVTEPLEYLMWQMGLLDCDTELLGAADRESLEQIRYA